MNIINLMNMMNYNLSKKNGKSMLGQIEKEIIDLYFLNPKKDLKDMDSFETNLFSNPNLFPGEIDYSGIADVNAYFAVKKEEFLKSYQQDSVVNANIR